MSNFHRTTLALLVSTLAVSMLAVPVRAATAATAGPATEIAIIHIARPMTATPAAMVRLQRRIAAAALEVCGASAFSAPGVHDAVAHSACWRQSYADGMAQAGPLVHADSAALSLPHSPGKP